MKLRFTIYDLRYSWLAEWLACFGLFLVAGRLQAQPSNAPPSLAPVYPEIPPTLWQQHNVAVIIGGILFIVVQSLWLYKMLMRLQPKVEPVENLTRAALNRLANEPEDGKLLSEVSRILRDYFGKQFQMRGAEATTAEFIAALGQNKKIPSELAGKISSFLNECDVKKFSRAVSAKDSEAVERAMDLVNEAESVRQTLQANGGTAK